MEFVSADDLHQPEMPLIVEHKPVLILQMKNGVRELRIFVFVGQYRESPAHPQVNDQCFFTAEVEQNMLASAMDEIDLCLQQITGKNVRLRIRCKSST